MYGKETGVKNTSFKSEPAGLTGNPQDKESFDDSGNKEQIVNVLQMEERHLKLSKK